MKGVSHDWSTLETELREAAATPGGAMKMAERTGIAYSTITKHMRDLGLTSLKANRRVVDEKAAKHYRQKYKFNAKPMTGKAPEGEAVIPKGVKITKCPDFQDRRFAVDPSVRGEFSKLGVGRYMEE